MLRLAHLRALSDEEVGTAVVGPLHSNSTSAFPGAPRRTTVSTLNPAVVNAEYAVRGEIVIRADQIRRRLSEQQSKPASVPAADRLPFDEVISCNIGNPHELGQKPLTFFRQVAALCQYPALLQSGASKSLFPADAIHRAQLYLNHIKGGVGAYSASQGIPVIREEVAQFIRSRDGGIDSYVRALHRSRPHRSQHCVYAFSNADDIFLTDGASSGVKMIINMLIRDEKDGVRMRCGAVRRVCVGSNGLRL